MLSTTLDNIVLPIPIFRDNGGETLSIDRILQLLAIYDFLGFKSFMLFGGTYSTDNLSAAERAEILNEIAIGFPAATIHLIADRAGLGLALSHEQVVPYLSLGRMGPAVEYLNEFERVLIDSPACRAYLHPRDFITVEEFRNAALESLARAPAKVSKHYEQPEEVQVKLWQRPDRLIVGTDRHILTSIARQAHGIVSPVLSCAPHLVSECGDIVSLETAIMRLRESLGTGAEKRQRMYVAARRLGEATSAPRRRLGGTMSPYHRGDRAGGNAAAACIENSDKDFAPLNVASRTLNRDYLFTGCTFEAVRLEMLNLGGKKIVFKQCAFNGPVSIRDLRGRGRIELHDCEFAERLSIYNASIADSCPLTASKCRVQHPIQAADCNLDSLCLTSCFLDGVQFASSSFKTLFAIEGGSVVRDNLSCDLALDGEFRMTDAECGGRLSVFLSDGGKLAIRDAKAGEILIAGKPGEAPAAICSLTLEKVDVDSDLAVTGIHYEDAFVARDVGIRGSLHLRGLSANLTSSLELYDVSVRDSLLIEATKVGPVQAFDVRFQAVRADETSRRALELYGGRGGIRSELDVLQVLKREATETSNHSREDRYAFKIETLRARIELQERKGWLGKALILIKNLLRRYVLGYGLDPLSPLVSFAGVALAIVIWNVLDHPQGPVSIGQALGNVTSTLFFLEAIDNPTVDTHLTVGQVNTVVVARIVFFGIIGSSIVRKLIRR